ncbi:MAG: hypothetical protein R3A46_10365 [Thermomicrobiales bacterium]
MATRPCSTGAGYRRDPPFFGIEPGQDGDHCRSMALDRQRREPVGDDERDGATDALALLQQAA